MNIEVSRLLGNCSKLFQTTPSPQTSTGSIKYPANALFFFHSSNHQLLDIHRFKSALFIHSKPYSGNVDMAERDTGHFNIFSS